MKYRCFSEMPKVFPDAVINHTDFFPKILIFLVIYTDFVSDHSGRSVCAVMKAFANLIQC